MTKDIIDEMRERKSESKKSLGRMILAESYLRDDVLSSNGYSGDTLRERFSKLYKYIYPKRFVFEDLPSSVGMYDNLRGDKSIYLSKVREYFKDTIPDSYLLSITEDDLNYGDFTTAYLIKVSIIYIIEEKDRYRFVKGEMTIKEVEMEMMRDIDVEIKSIRFEELDVFDAFNSIEGIGNIVNDYDLIKILKSL